MTKVANGHLFLLFQPNREDEHARIEAAGGKVIQWNGHRVFGVLAMSRSIGTCSIPLSWYSFFSFPIFTTASSTSITRIVLFVMGK